MAFKMKGGGGDYELAPAGVHLATCYLMAYTGYQENPFGAPKPELIIAWELVNEFMEDGRPFAVSKIYNASTNEKATIRLHIESWRGKPFSEEEVEEFDPKTLLGKSCQLQVSHEAKKDKVFTKVTGVMALPKGTKVATRHNSLVWFDASDESSADISQLPEWIRKRVLAAVPGPSVDADKEAPASTVSDDDLPF